MTIFLMPTRLTDRNDFLTRLETVLVPMLIGRSDEDRSVFSASNDNQLSGNSRPPKRLPRDRFRA